MRPSVSCASAAVVLSRAAISSAAIALFASRWSQNVCPRPSCSRAVLWPKTPAIAEATIAATNAGLIATTVFLSHIFVNGLRNLLSRLRDRVLFRQTRQKLQICCRQPQKTDDRSRCREDQVRRKAERKQPRHRRKSTEKENPRGLRRPQVRDGDRQGGQHEDHRQERQHLTERNADSERVRGVVVEAQRYEEHRRP